MYDEKTIRRFWKYVNKQSGIIVPYVGTECWVWTSALVSKGYGVLHVLSPHKDRYAHRISYRLAYGEFDESLMVLHRCDVMNCVRPDHLFLGTPKDNMADMYAKGRGRKALYETLTQQERDKIRCDFALWDGTAADFAEHKGMGIHILTTIIGDMAEVKRSVLQEEKSRAIASEYDTGVYSMTELADKWDNDIVIIHRAVAKYLSKERREELKAYHIRRKNSHS